MAKKKSQSLLQYDPTLPVWERQPFDTDTTWSHFVVFRDMPTSERMQLTWRGFARIIERADSYEKELSEMFNEKDWKRRVEEYDSWKRGQDKNALEQRKQTAETNLYSDSQRLRKLWESTISNWERDMTYVKTELLAQNPDLTRVELTYSAQSLIDLTKAREAIDKLERRALKMPEQFTAQKVEMEITENSFDKYLAERRKQLKELTAGDNE